MQLTTSLIATLAAITPALAHEGLGDCYMASGGPGEEAGLAVFDFFIRDFVQPQFYDEVCPLGQDQLTGDLPGKWCGRCDGAQLSFLHDGAFDNRCFTSDDVYEIMDGTDVWSQDECGANIKNDAYLTITYGSEGWTNAECDNYC